MAHSNPGRSPGQGVVESGRGGPSAAVSGPQRLVIKHTPLCAFRVFARTEPCDCGAMSQVDARDWPVRGEGRPIPLEQRFWEKVDASGDCWEWRALRNPEGYGIIRYRGRNLRAHRVAYELRRGAIPEGMELDHLCRNRGCVWPGHLEPVTHHDNGLRARLSPLVCKRGHRMTPENVITGVRGGRQRRECRTCVKALQGVRMARWKARHA